ncbi:CHAT domain-containing protein [Sphingomonas sp. RIT328]|uniref:CHAT domain-containing protein n=1 Tax=Sphingomonas sp. RIT328 TaxID=1470591 RepID=UPI00044508C7|nr:CHAT domain-containing protein [Sphingomonas sp. RIT328]EZP49963.1 CHAT domain protein [Sphingomonas sp. RIT328]
MADLATKLTALLEARHLGMIGELRASMIGDAVLLRGQVGSEASRSDAKRFALSFDGVFKVRNDLEVVGYLSPASDDDLDGYFQSAAPEPLRRTRGLGDGSRRRPVVVGRPSPMPTPTSEATRDTGGVSAGDMVDVLRRPSISTSSEILPDRLVEVVVDLSDVTSDSPAVVIGRFPADWTKIVVSVQLVAPWAIRVDALSPTVTLTSDGRSVPARFACLVSPDFDGSTAQAQAVFMHGTRICGHVSIDLLAPEADGIEKVRNEAPAAAAGATAGEQDVGRERKASVRIVPDAVGPTLTVTVLTTGADLQTWTWQAAMPGGMAPGVGRVDLQGGAKAFADMQLASCPDLKPPRVSRMMDGLGERLWRVAPAEFRAGYEQWRNALGSDFAIQFITEDPYIPWEMMKPDISGARHLFVDHPVARWPAGRSVLLRESFGTGELLSFVPSYGAGQGLPAAQAEGRWMVECLGATAMPARTEAFFAVLDGERPGDVAVIHFAGHGRIDTGQSDGGIQMEDDFVGVAEVDQRRTVVGERGATLVLLNACETAGGAQMLGMNTGWGAAIAARGFGGLVAPLWEVDDAMAFQMMKSALPDLLAGRCTLGEALRNSRRAHHAESASPFAYLAHGDVMARFPG